MTVQTTTRSQTYAGGQSALTFTFRTLVSNPNYILVNVISGGTTTPLVYNVGYTVSVNSSGVGGTVTVSPTYSTAYTYVVYRQTGVTQNSAYSDYNAFPSSTVENNLDQLTMINQENSDNANRAITLPIGSSPSISTALPLPVANDFLAWDPTASFLINTPGVAGPTGPQGPSGSTISISSSTSDLTVVTTSTTAVLTVNAATSGSNKVLKLDSSGNIPPLNGLNLINVPSFGSIFTPSSGVTYTPSTSGLVLGTATSSGGGSDYARITVVANGLTYISLTSFGGQAAFVCVPVIKGNTYNITTDGTGSPINIVRSFYPMGN